MKKFGLVFSLVLFFSVSSQVNAQWFWQNPLPQGNELFGVNFVNDNLGWAVGRFGTIIKTTDGGSSWGFQKTTEINSLKDISFYDPNYGLVVGNDGIVLTTSNGGMLWEPRISTTQIELNSVQFVNENTAITVGYRGTILRSSDKGQTWNGIYVEALQDSIIRLNDIFLKSNSELFVVGEYGLILKSIDAGLTWETHYLNPDKELTSISFINDSTGLIVENSKTIYKTTDGGTTWNPLTINTFGNILKGVIINEATIILLKTYGFLVSTDSGNTWVEKYNHYIFNDLKMLNNDQILMVGHMGLIIKSSNFGIDWQFLSTIPPDFPGSLLDIKFVDDLNGIAVGQNGTILKTSSGGNSWNSLPSGTLDDLIEITYLDANRIVILGINRFEYHSILLKTEDGGMNWESKIFENVLYNDMFINGNIGILIGDLGKILRSTDSLKTWVGISSGTTKRLDAISISDNLNGMVVGENGGILKTSDGGLTWTSIQNLPINYYSDIVCFNQYSAIVIGNLGTIFKTLNAGANWNSISINTTNNLNSVSFFNNNNGMISCDNGVILKTTNEGYSWQLQQTITNNNLQGVFIKDGSFAWTVGGNGFSVLHTTNGGVTFIEEENSPTQPRQFLLQQNYPNPFNPSTKISWQSPVSGWQTLKVYDILGNEVATLVDEYRNAGSYNEQFTINNVQLSSGVYFYQLRVGEHLETKKMMLLK